MSMNETELQVLIKKDKVEVPTTHPLQHSLTPEDPNVSEIPGEFNNTEDPGVSQDLQTADPSPLEIASLEKIKSTQVELSKVKKSLGEIIDTIADNPSYFSQAANAWGKLPLWQKIVGGVVLSGPVLAVGLFAHVGVLMVIGGVTGAAYTASGVILEDHHTHNVSVIERLKTGLFNLADVLQLTIDALDNIRKDFAAEIEKFKKENGRLTENINTLNDSVEQLSIQVDIYIDTEKHLRATKEELETTAKSLQQSVDAQSDLLAKTQSELEAVKSDYAKAQVKLSKSVADLQAVRTKMSVEVEQARKVGANLQGALNMMVGTVLEDEQQQKSYMDKLNELINTKSATLEGVSKSMTATEKELALVKEQLKEANKVYQELLAQQKAQTERQEEQIKRLEALVASREADSENTPPKTAKNGNATVLKQHGLYKDKAAKPLKILEAVQPLATLVQ